MIPEIPDELERMQADGRISPDDADEVREFTAFLNSVGPGSKADPERVLAALRRRYPEFAAKPPGGGG